MLNRAIFALMVLVSGTSLIAAPAAFPTFGVSFTAPNDSAFTVGQARNIVAHYSFAKNSPFFGGEIVIEINPANHKTLADLTATFSANPAMTVDPKPLTIGGEAAVRISMKSTKGPARRLVISAVIHENQMYLFTTAAPEGLDATAPMAELLASVKFVPVESPVRHLDEMSDTPVNAFGVVSVRVPTCVRYWQQADKEMNVGILDLANPGNPFNVNIQRMVAPTPKSFADIRDSMSQILQTQLNASEPLQWHDQSGLPGLHVTQPVKTRAKLPNGKEMESISRFSLLDMGGGNFVQILFTISDKSPDQIPKYVDLSERMLATVAILPKQPTTKP